MTDSNISSTIDEKELQVVEENYTSIFKSNGQDGEVTNLTVSDAEANLVSVLSEASYYFTNPTPTTSITLDGITQASPIPQSNFAMQPFTNSNLVYSEFVPSNTGVINESNNSEMSRERSSSFPSDVLSQNIVNWQQSHDNFINCDIPSMERRTSDPLSNDSSPIEQSMMDNFNLLPPPIGYYPQIPLGTNPEAQGNQWSSPTNYAPFFSTAPIHPEIMINQQQPFHPETHMSPQNSTTTSLTSFQPDMVTPVTETTKQTSFFKNLMSSGKKKEEFKMDVVLEGYLNKLTRNGVWQRRFFEVDGVNLTYYKTHKRIKLLATLDLVKVGSIAVDNADPDGCTFTIQVSGRLYYLRAEDSATCKDWVINLNRVREARNEIGGLKLCTENHHTIEYKSMKVESESVDYSPVFVPILPHRPRLHHLDTSDHINHNNSFPTTSLLGERDVKVSPSSSVCSAPPTVGNLFENSEMHYTTPKRARPRERSPELFARWQKRRTKLQHMRSRLSHFLRWMTMKRRSAKDEFATSSDLNYLNRDTYSYAEDGATAGETVFSSSTTNEFSQYSSQLKLNRVSETRIIS